MVDQIVGGWRTADLSDVDRALCAFTEKLTANPAAIDRSDIAVLRQVGLDDPAISSATQVIAYFNYINRIAEGLGVHLEDWLGEDGRPLEPG